MNTEPNFENMVDVVLEHNCTPRGRLFEYPYRADESRKLIADAEKAVEEILNLAGLDKPKYGPEMQRPQYVRNKQAEALDEAASDMDALERLGCEPESVCSPEENTAYADYANSTRQDWLRARASELRTNPIPRPTNTFDVATTFAVDED